MLMLLKAKRASNHSLTKEKKQMSLNATQLSVLADLFETDPEFRSMATQRMAIAASEAEKLVSALRSFSPSTTGKTRGRPKGSKNAKKEEESKAPKAPKAPKVPKAQNEPSVSEPAQAQSQNRPDWKGKISAILKSVGKEGLRVSDIQDKLAAQGNPVTGGTLNTYLYGMKKEGAVRGEGTKGKTRYILA